MTNINIRKFCPFDNWLIDLIEMKSYKDWDLNNKTYIDLNKTWFGNNFTSINISKLILIKKTTLINKLLINILTTNVISKIDAIYSIYIFYIDIITSMSSSIIVLYKIFMSLKCSKINGFIKSQIF